MDLSLFGAILGAVAGVALNLILIFAKTVPLRTRAFIGIGLLLLAIVLLVRSASVARPGSDDEAVAVFAGAFMCLHFFIGLFALVAAYAAKNTREQYANFNALATTLGINGPGEVPKVKWYQAVPQPFMAGAIGRHQVRIQQRLVRSGKNTHIYLDFFVSVQPQNGLVFRISQDGVLSKVFGVFSSPEISLGDVELDDAFYIKGSPEPFLKALLTRPDVRRMLLDNKAYVECQCEKGWLTASSLGGMNSVSRLEWATKKITLLLRLADILDEQQGNRAPEA